MTRRLFEAFAIARFGARRQRSHHTDILIQCRLAFGLGRLHQECAVDDEGEIHGHRVEAFINHGLGEIEGGDIAAIEKAVVKQRLVHARALEGGT